MRRPGVTGLASMSDFRLQLAGLPDGPSRVRLTGRAAGLGLPADEWPDPIELDLAVDRGSEQVTLRGRLAASARVECGRCLERFPLAVDAAFAALAERGGRVAGAEAAAEDYVLPHDGRAVELDEAVREQLLLALPMVPLCRPDCAGLCRRCGADRNAGPCRCDTEPER